MPSLLLLLPRSTNAISLVEIVASTFIKGTLGTVANALNFILFGVIKLMQWTIDSALSIPIAPGAQGIVPLVETGWNVSRSLGFIILALTLVFIGLATILRLQNYQLQKTLPALVVIALLINFSGVLVGIVVDIGNILTNFFFGSIKTTWNLPWQGVSDQTTSGIIAFEVARVLYFGIAIFIYLAVVAIFFIRVLALWTIAMLAPLAFTAYVLPSTRKFWDQWLHALIQWAFVGVPMGFFLFLSSHALSLSQSDILPSNAQSPGVIAAFFGPFVALFLLFIGITISISMAPAQAQTIANWTRAQGSKAAQWARHKTATTVKDKVSDRVRSWAEKQAASRNPTWGQGKGGFGFAGRRAADVAGLARRSFGKGVGAVTNEKDVAQAADKKARAAKNARELAAILREEATQAGKARILAVAAQRRMIGDLMDENVVGKGNVLSKDEVLKSYNKLLTTDDKDAIEAVDRTFARRTYKDAQGNTVRYIDELGQLRDNFTKREGYAEKDRTTGGVTQEEINVKGYKNLLEKTVAEARTSDEIKQFGSGIVEDEAAMEAIDKHWGAHQAQTAATLWGREFVRPFGERMQKKGIEYYAELIPVKNKEGNVVGSRPRNTDLLRFAASSAAQGLGLSPLEGAETPEQVNTITRVANTLAGIKDDAARREVKTIIDKVRDLDSKRNIAEVLGKDPDLRSAFQSIKEERDQIEVARALAGIRGVDENDTKATRKEIAGILANRPALSNVANVLASFKGAERTTAANTLATVLNPPAREQVGELLRKNSQFLEPTLRLSQLAAQQYEIRFKQSNVEKMRSGIRSTQNAGGKISAAREAQFKEEERKLAEMEKATAALAQELDKYKRDLHQVPDTTPQSQEARRVRVAQWETLERLMKSQKTEAPGAGKRQKKQRRQVGQP
ncbi:MAG: hypothetical protein HYW95_02520 [Candidatus Wildermuthbacteria bacterium]|nr:hypothetical protein [Candidatus Wildermuthbacteria bacterium]